MAGRQACYVRTKSRSVDMDLETKPDDYSLEIGDGREVKVEVVQSVQPRSPETHLTSVCVLHSEGEEGRLSVGASGFA